MEADRKVNIVSVRKAARQLLKQVRRQREASRTRQKKVAKSKRKARCKVLKRMEKAAKLAARRLSWMRQPQVCQTASSLCPSQRHLLELNTKQTRKERKKAAKRLLKFAKTA
eukprot:g23416.t1